MALKTEDFKFFEIYDEIVLVDGSCKAQDKSGWKIQDIVCLAVRQET